MQILIQVMTIPGTPSLRGQINNDAKLHNFGLKVHSTKKIGRSEGWTKVHSLDNSALGAINIEWESSIRILMCRVATKSTDIPHKIMGDFIHYLLARYGDSIESINIMHRG